MLRFDFIDRILHLAADLRRVRRTRTKHDLKSFVHEFDGTHKMNNPFLSRDTANKEDVRFLNAESFERCGGVALPIFFEIDPVINDVEPLRLHVEEPFDVRFRLSGNSDHGIGHFERGLLYPNRKIVTAAELLAFPRTQRLE